jgi:3-dehydroquinate synthase
MSSEPIEILSDPALLLQAFLRTKGYSKIGVLMDENTKQHCYPLVRKTLGDHHSIEVLAGEENKTLTTCSIVWSRLTELGFDRHSLLIVLGGGVLGDLGGFCAATYKRGIDFLLLPTTLLAQVDASVGGKLGIDFLHYKNHIGLFQEPTAMLIGTDFLKTLPEREIRSGFAEIIKHCLISDRAMWDTIRVKSMTHQDWQSLIRHSVKFKSSIIKEDPKEAGLRKVLNFGHTVGHAVESYFLKEGNRIFHGEAIAIGMICESFIAHKKGLISEEELTPIGSYIRSVYGKMTLPVQTESILDLMAQDKKNKGDKILMALPKEIGKAVWDVEVSKKEIEDSLGYYASR